MDFYKTSADELVGLARDFYRSQIKEKQTFEETSQKLVKFIYNELRTADGEPLFALVRVFRFGPFDDVAPELKPQAKSSDAYWLTLMATIGVETAWCDRHTSQGHRLIPADSYATPMLRAAFQQLGLKTGTEIQSDEMEVIKDREFKIAGHFYIPKAQNSPYIPDQHFVERYGIQSVVGIGSPMLNNTAAICLGFSRAPLSQEDGEKFGAMSAFLMTTLSTYNSPEKLWRPTV